MTGPGPHATRIGAVAIGRNEGDRLIRCLDALNRTGCRIVYVDSGSTDDSVAAATDRGAGVVSLDMARPFTAARARNAGFDALTAHDTPDYVQFIDGDCEIDPDWISTARDFLDTRPDVAAVCGRLRERHPEASVFNWLCDQEWQGPPGNVPACGGIVMMRREAFAAAGGFNPDLIAGEEPELCLRLRGVGWTIWRLDADMALHDAAMTRFGQWWTRARRGGFTYAEGFALHGRGPERHKLRELRSALLWGLALPLAALAGAVVFSPWWLLLLLAWPLQILRLRRKGLPWIRALFLVLAKLPEAQGALQYAITRLRGGPRHLIEYK